MSQITFADQPRLDRDQLTKVLREAEEQYNPVDELLDMQRELIALEQRYGISSTELHRRFQAGEMGDAVEIVYWASLHRQYVELKSIISDSLDVVVSTSPVALPA